MGNKVENKEKKQEIEFEALPKNFGLQVLAFNNENIDIIIRNMNKKANKKYKIIIVEEDI